MERMLKNTKKLTYITTCKGRLHHLQETLPLVTKLPAISLVVVDYGCPDHAAEWVASTFPGVRVVKVEADYFNVARARNLGAEATDTEWLGFFDADIKIAPELFEQMLPGLNPGMFYLPAPMNRNCMGSCIVSRQAFEKVGGYDEAIDGWGGEDRDFYTMLGLNGYRQGGFPGEMLQPIRHSDAERMRFRPSKGMDRSMRLANLYGMIKFDALKLTGRTMELDQRRQLRNTLEEFVTSAAGSKAPREFRLMLGERRLRTRPPLPPDQRPIVRASLSYELLDYGNEQPNAD
jgi:glycosyltransferase involved in cell wall biosynthesis